MRREDHPRLRRLAALATLAVAAGVQAAPFVDAARGPTPIDQESAPPRLLNQINDDKRLPRNYRYQPPVIPHRIDGYQVDRSFNKCMDCHARERSAFSQAVPVSRTHYVDREGRVLDRISSRRYFCKQCHVAQEPVEPLVRNGFRGDPGDATPLPAPAVAGSGPSPGR